MKPIIFFDTETTGTDIVEDRIVQLAVLKVDETGSPLKGEQAKEIIMNPGKPISPGATKVHGITDDMVKDAPPFGAYAKSIYEYFRGCDVAGFNIKRFDVPLMAEEFARVGITWPEPGTEFVDMYQIFAKKEPRDLGAALKFYNGKSHENAHNATADILATIDVFKGQMFMYKDLAEMSISEINAFCEGDERWVDLAGKIILNAEGIPVYSFGKDKDKSIKSNPGFAQWMLKGNFPSETKKQIKKILGYGS